MHKLSFVSGDQDFAPLLEAVVRDGMYVELLYPEGHTSDDLKYFADVATPMHIDFLYLRSTEAFRRQNGLPTICGNIDSTPANSVLIGEGRIESTPYAKVWRESATGLTNITTIEPCASNNNYWSVRDRDESRAKRYFTMRMSRDFGLCDKSLAWANCE